MKYFFSYSRHDGELIKQLARDLKARNMNVWLDQLDIPVGSKWDTCIEHALNESTGIILALSKASVASDNVMDEVSYAINKGKHIIPILLDDCDVPFRIARIQLIDFHTDYNRGIETIMATIYAHNKAAQPVPAPSVAAPITPQPVAPPSPPPPVSQPLVRKVEPEIIPEHINYVSNASKRRKKKIRNATIIVAALLLLGAWLLMSAAGNELYSSLLTKVTDSDYLSDKQSLSGILVIVVVGAISGWIAGMIVDSENNNLLLDVVVGIAGGYIASKWVFHGIWHLTEYYYVNLTLTTTIGALILSAIIRLIRKGAR